MPGKLIEQLEEIQSQVADWTTAHVAEVHATKGAAQTDHVLAVYKTQLNVLRDAMENKISELDSDIDENTDRDTLADKKHWQEKLEAAMDEIDEMLA